MRTNSTAEATAVLEDEPLPLRVIILTQMRSGSSFTGEIFNKNDEFFYLFEPLHNLEPKFDANRTNENMETFIKRPLRDFLQCNFKNLPVPWWSEGVMAFHQCNYAKPIQASPLCLFQIEKNRWLGRNISNSTDTLESLCRSKKHVALKTIRIRDINYLKDLITDASMDTKIIHLVRDPRGTYRSKMEVCKPFMRACLSINETCDRMRHNIQFWLDPPQWIQNKYLLTRFEDLAMEPIFYAETIYKFLNIPMPRSVYDWIINHTKHTSNEKTRSFTHPRVASRVVAKWRTSLELSQVLEIQAHCKLVMDKLGYKSVENVTMLRDLNYSVIEPINDVDL